MPSFRLKASLYTFIAVFVTILLIGIVSIPFGLDYAEDLYFKQQADFNARMAGLMSRFVQGRLADGQPEESIIQEFQQAIEGTQTDAGYVCLIDQGDVRYLSHPDLNVMGMAVKPMALFDPNFTGTGESPWQDHLRLGETDTGLLHLGEGMPSEIVHFISLPGINWTVSSHENIARVQHEVKQLRSMLTWFSVLLGIMIAVPASIAARRVNKFFQDELDEKHQLERQLLESENARKSQELAGARAQQLSMLPAAPPEMERLSMAFYMNPATEVGGDYYDYRIGEHGELTIAIGDATGHGVQASTLVTTMKTLFTNLAETSDLIEILKQSTRSIRQMGISKLYMAFALARITDNILEIVGAGMPPALLYRAETGEVESIPLKGMPLGAIENYPYETITAVLKEGDLLLLLSDGYPEQFNSNREILGYDKAEKLLFEVGNSECEAVIEQCKRTLLDWQGDEEQSDDVTFVAIKFKT